MISWEEVTSMGIRCSLKKGEKEAGRAYLFLIRNELHSAPYGLLEDVYVEEQFRSSGIGTELVQTVINLARELGCYKLIATSRIERGEVHEWYEGLGFLRYGYEFRLDF